jgi:alginate O-acetyltransferase complex protein AlgI
MLFSSYEFVLAFLPASVLSYFLVLRFINATFAKLGLFLFSIIFYSYWDIRFTPLLIGSILVNFYLGKLIDRHRLEEAGGSRISRLLLWVGILANLGVIGLFKYFNFFVENLNAIPGVSAQFVDVILPIGISFFTFQQIAYLVDVYRRAAKEYSILDYGVFVTFFPQLIAGPIVHHKQVMPQFASVENRQLNWYNIDRGTFIFALGLFKKVVIADSLALWANQGFADALSLNFFESWIAALSYTFQLYFDFSGYADMAIGIALMFNIVLPVNFYSPYKALDIQEFWRRWHITLSRFLRDYVYISIGGNRCGWAATLRNLFVTFLLGGLWHGAGWTFIVWGALHGGAIVAQRIWSRLGLTLPRWLSWLVTFVFVVFAWVFFRAENLGDATAMVTAMLGINGIILPGFLEGMLAPLAGIGVEFSTYWFTKIDWHTARYAFIVLPVLTLFVLFSPNTVELLNRFRPGVYSGVAIAIGLAFSLALMREKVEFIYYQF